MLVILRLGRLTGLMRSWKMTANQTGRYAAIMKKKRLKGDEAASVGGHVFHVGIEARLRDRTAPPRGALDRKVESQATIE